MGAPTRCVRGSTIPPRAEAPPQFGVPAALFHACRITGRERQTVIANSCVPALRWVNSKNWSLD